MIDRLEEFFSENMVTRPNVPLQLQELVETGVLYTLLNRFSVAYPKVTVTFENGQWRVGDDMFIGTRGAESSSVFQLQNLIGAIVVEGERQSSKERVTR